jgi:general secretion pathway protein D
MTIHYTRIFRILTVMLCVNICMHAALNFVHDEAQNVNSQPSTPQQQTAILHKSLATQVELPPIETPAPRTPENNHGADKTQRLEAPGIESDDNDDETVEFHFEDADLQNLLNQIASLYKVIFITDDMISPPPADKKLIQGNKISFKTNKPLTRKAAWSLFLSFLDIAGFTLTKESKPNIFRIVPLPNNTPIKSPIPSYIGTNPKLLPNNDQMIHYVYFVHNTSIETIFPIVDSLRSTVSSLKQLTELQAFLLTDKAYNIMSLMEIVTELDKVTMPQSMSVLKLKRADAKDVKDLYEELTGKKDTGAASRLFPARKQSTAVFFPENLRIIAYPRTNALILLGSEDAIKKIEDFVINHVDVNVTAPYPPIRVHNLRFADATSIASIMNGMTDFGKGTPAGDSGGVRGEDKYIKRMTFTAEPESNRLVIQGDEEDYLMAKEILDKLDERQPQVAIEVLLLSVSVGDNKQLGTQLRSKDNGTPDSGTSGLLGNTVKFQTSGLYGTTGIQTVPESAVTSGANRLLANLINLAVGAPTGNTLVSLGTDAYGVWGLLQALQTVTNTQIVATPFLVATNKTPAKVTIGQTRRVTVATVVATATESSQDDKDANLVVSITPQINSDGMIVLDLDIRIDQFADATNFTSATVNTKRLITKTIVSNGEVLALGGLIQNNMNLNMSQTPILGKIPILGWLFKNRQDTETKNNLLILICPRILPPDSDKEANKFTNDRVIGYHATLADMMVPTSGKDPISKFFFDPKKNSTETIMEDYLFKRHDTPKKLATHEKPRLKNNQRARKRSSRNSFAEDTKDTEHVSPPAQQNQSLPQEMVMVAQNNNTDQGSAENTPPGTSTSRRRSPQRSRRSLSTYMDDTAPEGAAS